MSTNKILYSILIVLTLFSCSKKQSGRWSEEKINNWYKNQPWLVGANYVPASAINQLEMWQAETFNPNEIDKELHWAEDMGFNTMRVFLHHILWEQDTKGFLNRMDTFLNICHKHKIKPMLVLLDDVWHPEPRAGKQPEPTKGVHNSGWVQSPGREILIDELQHHRIEKYIKGVISHFANDKRVLTWDLYNEPGNGNGNSYGKQSLEPKNKDKHSLILLKKVYKWARKVNPSQPLSIDVWTAGHADIKKLSAIDKFAFDNSDFINFHAYFDKKRTEKVIKMLLKANRPIVCTEYMARSQRSTFQEILPLFKKYNVGAYNWGFVNGKSQTIYPWHSWNTPFKKEPELWFHDILRKDGTPYIKEEVDFIRNITDK